MLEAVGPELDTAVPPRHDDEAVVRVQDAQDVGHLRAGAVLAVVVVVRVADAVRVHEAVREHVVRGFGDILPPQNVPPRPLDLFIRIDARREICLERRFAVDDGLSFDNRHGVFLVRAGAVEPDGALAVLRAGRVEREGRVVLRRRGGGRRDGRRGLEARPDGLDDLEDARRARRRPRGGRGGGLRQLPSQRLGDAGKSLDRELGLHLRRVAARQPRLERRFRGLAFQGDRDPRDGAHLERQELKVRAEDRGERLELVAARAAVLGAVRQGAHDAVACF